MRVGLLAVVTAVVCGPSVANAQIVISEVYGGGGNSGATLRNDFVELYNKGTSAVDVTGWTVQYSLTTGLFEPTEAAPLSGLIPAGATVYVQFASSGANGTVYTGTVFATGTANFNPTSGSVALANSGTRVSGPSGTNVVDFVGYGTATKFEGTGAAPAPSVTTSIARNGSLADTNNNAADFITGAPTPGVAAVPEPGSLILVGATCLGVLGWRYRTRAKNASQASAA